MKVREILAIKGEHVHTIEPDRTILDAVALLVEHGIGALLVRDAGGAVAGIISERDVLRVSRDRSGELGTIRIGDVMTRDLVICVPATRSTTRWGSSPRTACATCPSWTAAAWRE
jgi:CBS domain-containing protein